MENRVEREGQGEPNIWKRKLRTKHAEEGMENQHKELDKESSIKRRTERAKHGEEDMENQG